MKTHSKTKFMLLAVLFVAMVTPPLATANTIDKLKFWEEKPLRYVGFSYIYPKPLYKKSYFGGMILGATVVAAGAFSYFTAGGGAPSAALGVGYVASWIGGGVPGAYMIGLSKVGGIVGGNAMVGSAILNGISYGVMGGVAAKGATKGAITFETLSAGGKFGVIASVSATVLDGVTIINNPDTGQLQYFPKLILPEDLGSDRVITLVKEINENKEKRVEASAKGDDDTASRHQKLNEINMEHAESMLNKLLESNQKIDRSDQEDLLVLSMVSHENGNIELFQKGLKKFSRNFRRNSDDYGYLQYLEAIDYLYDRKNENALRFLENSIRQNPYAIEPIILYVNVLSQDLSNNEQRILDKIDFAEENYNSNIYSSPYSLLALFFRAGTIYHNNQRCVKAKQYFEKAKNEIDFIEGLFPKSDNLKNQIQLGIANSYYCMADKKKAWEIFRKITKSMEGDELTALRQQFAGYDS